MLEKEYFEQFYESINYEDDQMIGHRYQDCSFKGCTFFSPIWDHTDFDNCFFIECQIISPIINKAQLEKPLFQDCKIVGLNLANCRQIEFNLRFKECKILNCNFGQSNLRDSSFINCLISETSFQESELSGVNFENSQFNQVLFHRTILKKALFKGASGYSINPLDSNIEGASFSVPEVLNLLSPFHIKIIDP